jgi:response regulator of citrate/malate metabolism
LVVEDDRVVARLHCRFISKVSGFSVVGVAAGAAQATEMVRVLHPDLLLLDIGLPGEDGIALLRRLRGASVDFEVIAVTAATATSTVRAAVQLGAVDYLVKPFDHDRLRKSLRLFERRMAMLDRAELAQRDVDLICSEGPNVLRWLPRDVSGARLDEIRLILSGTQTPETAEAVATRAGVARVTARRYLEYLVTIGQATMEPVVDGPGRPRKTYRLRSPAA